MKTLLLKIALVLITLAMSTSAFANRKLCLIGDATRYGWDKGNASPMIQDVTNQSVFYYNAWLTTGNFKFILENTDDSWLPTWNKADDTHIVKRVAGSDPDEQFNISVAGNYAITVDTTSLTISIVPMSETTEINFNTIFMLGDATPNGWTITDATELTKSATNPFEFTYSGPMNVGEFKFCVNRNSGWGQDFFTKVSDTQMILQNSPDVKWNILEAGNYNIKINLQTMSILVEKQTTTLSSKQVTNEISIKCSLVNDELWIINSINTKYQILAINGIVLQTGFTQSGQINVSNLKTGLYILKAENNSFRFIKK